MRPLALVLLLVGCGGDDAGGGDAARATPTADAGLGATDGAGDAGAALDASVEPWIEIGTGDRRFEPLEPGQTVPVIEGIQGGYHVWGAFRGGGFSGTDAKIDFEMTLAGKVVANANYTEPELPRDANGDFDYPAVAVIYISNDDVGPTMGQTMTLSVKVTANDGQVFTDRTTIVPDCCVLPTGMRTGPP